MERKIFSEIKATPLESALNLWRERLKGIDHLEAECIRVEDSLGRITAEAVFARLSSPSYHSSAMDGYAVRFKDTIGASERTPKRLRIGSDAIYLDTGDPMPEGYNAVIMVEDAEVIDNHIEIIAPVTPWQNVRIIGEDIVGGELIIAENHKIRPFDISAMLASGIREVKVKKQPKIVFIPTGDEIVEPCDNPRLGEIIESNSSMLLGLALGHGAEGIRLPIEPDDPERIKKAVLDASDSADIICVLSGASLGSEDYTSKVISDIGEVLVHGIAIKPGKPAILGLLNQGKRAIPIIGIPGYPVSAYIVFELFVRPAIYALYGVEPEPQQRLKVRLSRQISSPLGQEEFIRVKVGRVGEGFVATPLGRGAGLLMSLVRADGIIRVPANSEGISQGAEVEVSLLRTKKEIENTLVSIGSHDNVLDILANFLKKRYPEFSLSSAHVGSLGGLMALKMSEAHIAPTHLLDEETGEYNVPFIKKLLPSRKITLINLLYRTQGLMVRAGNPKGITKIEDLVRDDITFINRQRGAGTRLLLDKYLKEKGIDPKDIKGYEREEYTHMAVASAVLTGVADTGLGVLSAAKALGLDFIAFAKERYDLAILNEYIGLPMVEALLEIIRYDEDFKNSVLALGGYDISDMGKIMWQSP